MCGILGMFGSSLNLNPMAIDSALQTFKHRGPDQQFNYQSDFFAAGVNRLAINDVEGGQQPFFGSDKSVVAVYNGEIYNHKQLRQKLIRLNIKVPNLVDGAVIPFLYEQFGEKFVELLDGMYAVAVYDSKSRKLLLSRDIAGEKPLYYSITKNNIGFSSFLTAFKYMRKSTLNLNYQAIWDLVSFLWVPEPSTIYKEVFSLNPGETLVFDLNGKTTSTIRKYSKDENFPKEDIDAENYLLESLKSNIESCLMSDVPIGTFLSGGLDSSIVTSVASKNSVDLDTYSVTFENTNDPYHGQLDEGPLAKNLSQKLGTRHHEIPMTSNYARSLLDDFIKKAGQPFAVSSGLGVLAVANAAKLNGNKVLLSGDGADELFGGYSWYAYLEEIFKLRLNKKSRIPLDVTMQDVGIDIKERVSLISQYSDKDLLFALHYYGTESEKQRLFSKEFYHDNELLESNRVLEKISDTDFTIDSVIKSDQDVYLSQEMLRKVDLFTMASSIEGRVPFVRRDIFKISQNLSFNQLVEGGDLKSFLKKSVKSILPQDVISRPKHGFNFPIDQWLESDWSDLVEDTFSPSSYIFKLGIIDENSLIFAKELLRSSVKLNGHTIFALIVLERFLQIEKDNNCCEG